MPSALASVAASENGHTTKGTQLIHWTIRFTDDKMAVLLKTDDFNMDSNLLCLMEAIFTQIMSTVPLDITRRIFNANMVLENQFRIHTVLSLRETSSTCSHKTGIDGKQGAKLLKSAINGTVLSTL